MKSKIVATIGIVMLLCGILAVLPIKNAAAVDPPYYLNIATNPLPSIPTEPAVGQYTYQNTVWQNVTAALEYIVGNTKYVFLNWTVTPLTDDYSVALGQMWVHMDGASQSKTATAYYKTQYKVTLNPNPFVALGVKDWMWSTDDGWMQQNSMWVDAGDQAKVGVNGLSAAWFSAKLGVYTDLNYRWAFCDGFDTDFSGFNTNGVDDATSDLLTVNGPKTGNSIWAFIYALYVYSDPNPPVPNPAGTNWYSAGSTATLTANDYSTNFAVYRYTLDHWTVDGDTKPGNPIDVTMGWNHTAIAYYKRQSRVYVEDNVGNASFLETGWKWFDDGVPYIFTAPSPIPMVGYQYLFKYWDKPGYVWTSTDNPLTITFDASWDGEHLRARYQGQYNLEIKSNPVIAGFLYDDSSVTGWYDWGSTQSMKAKPEVTVGADLKYVFKNWTNNYGWSGTLNNYTFTLDKPYIETAYYEKQYLCTWNHNPASLTIAGSPGQYWAPEGYDLWYSLQQFSGTYVFYYWKINGVQYAYNDNNVHVGIVTGPVDGTAYYVEKTKIFMDPSIYPNPAPVHYCHEFNVTVYASNFNANRTVDGKPMDIYAFEIGIKWDAALLELKSVNLNLADFFAPNAYFPGPNVISPGYYTLIATVKGNFTGFSGTKAMFTMTFHVIYEACYGYQPWTWIEFDPQKRLLSNHLNDQITPELGWKDCYYKMKPVMPMIDIRNKADGTHLVKVDWNVPQVYFDTEVWLLDGVKVHDFWINIDYDETMIDVDKVVIANYLKAPFNAYTWWKAGGMLYVWVVQDSSVPLQNGTGLLFTITFKVVDELYYTTGGPWVLETDIVVVTGTYLSVNCGQIYVQEYDVLLGANSCHYVYNPIPGDLDYDGCVTCLDLQKIIDYYHLGLGYDVLTGGFGSQPDLYDLVFVALRYGNCAPGKTCP